MKDPLRRRITFLKEISTDQLRNRVVGVGIAPLFPTVHSTTGF
jgi:hypothetical protein